MKNFIFILVRTYMQMLSVVAPKKAAKKALAIFFTPKKNPSKSWENTALERARSITLSGGIDCLIWGDEAAEPVLLVHGWEGRASQMSVLLPYLEDKYKVIAINAPAHGSSQGMQSHPHKFIEAIFCAQEHFGAFHAIVGHSMGGGCAVYAALENLNVNKVVSIAGPADFENSVSAFANFIGLKARAKNRFLKDVEAEVDIPFSQLKLANRAKNLEKPLLIVHDRNDVEVPFAEGVKFKPQIKQGEFFATKYLGHRRIMRSKCVLEKITDFIVDNDGTINNA